MDSSRALNRIAATGALLLWVAACGSGGGSTPAQTPPPLAGFAYVANELDNTVSIYSIGAGSGQLNAQGYVPAGTSPLSVTVDPQSRFAYAANLGSGDVSAYTINATTGALTPISCVAGGAAVCTGSNFKADAGATSVVVHPSGKFAYVANFTASNVSQYTIASNGALLAASAVAAGTNASAIAVDPTGKFAYVANYTSNDVSGYMIDATTGVLTQISCGPAGAAGCTGATEPTNFAAGTNPFSLAIDPTGKFAYVANYGSSDISAYTISATTGALTQISCGTPGTPGCTGTAPPTNFANGSGAISIVVDPTGKFVYTANLVSNDVSAYAIGGTGALTHISCGPVGTAGCVGTAVPTNFAAGKGANAVAVDPTGKFAYVANLDSNNIAAYAIDATTGALTQISCGAVGTQGCSGTTLPTLFAAGTAPVSLVVAKPGTSPSLPTPAP